MSDFSPKMSVRTCSSCGAALNRGALTCRSCGGIVIVEQFFGRLKAEARYQNRQVQNYLGDRRRWIWILALFPIIILPPALAIFINVRAWRLQQKSETMDSQAAAFDVSILIAAICNIILSILFWRWIGEFALSVVSAIALLFKSTGGVSHPSGGIRSI